MFFGGNCPNFLCYKSHFLHDFMTFLLCFLSKCINFSLENEIFEIKISVFFFLLTLRRQVFHKELVLTVCDGT